MNVVVSQPMYLPWAGLFEQVKLADVFVHYDDVQLPQGRSFTTRVQLKTQGTVDWLSVPIKKATRGLILDAEIEAPQESIELHIKKITHALSKAPHFADVENMLAAIKDRNFEKISDLNIFFTELAASYFGFKTKFYKSSTYQLQSKSTEKLVDICKIHKATKYITGHGAKNYMDHESFEKLGITVEYMNYSISPYPQSGDFTPYVTVLDLIAQKGKEALNHMCSSTVNWKDFSKNE